VLVALAALVATACSGQTRNPFDQSPGAQGTLSIHLENRGFNDVRVFAITPAGATSLGPVSGNTVERATLPWRQAELISFRIEVLAGRTYTTHTLPANPGDRLELIIPQDPADAILRPRSSP